MTLRLGLLLLFISMLCACGFQLRGSNLGSLKNATVYVQSRGAGALANELKEQLGYSEVTIANKASEADYIIDISNENFERKVLSVSPRTGKVEEYEIYYQALLTITGPDGKNLIKSEPITAQRDYVFDEGSVYASFDQEQELRKDISKYAASNVLRRLQAVIK